MKTIFVTTLALILSVSFTSCEEVEAIIPDVPSNDQNNQGSDPGGSNNQGAIFQLTASDLQTNLTSKNWKINMFIEDFDNETNDFNGYYFSFTNDGNVSATRGDTTRTGTWRTFTDDGETELWMSFPYSGYFSELSDDWYLRINSTDQVRLEGSNPNKDVLVLVPY
jgi:hypothetical protein